jgi:lysine decarboxylase
MRWCGRRHCRYRQIKQNTDEYIDTILPPLTKALFKYVREGKYTFCTPGHMGGTAFQKAR